MSGSYKRWVPSTERKLSLVMELLRREFEVDYCDLTQLSSPLVGRAVLFADSKDGCFFGVGAPEQIDPEAYDVVLCDFEGLPAPNEFLAAIPDRTTHIDLA